MSRPLIALTTLLALGGLTCARSSRIPRTDTDVDLMEPAPGPDSSAAFVLTWQGLRIGDATEELRRHRDGLRLVRHERLFIRRGGATVRLVTRIAIDTDANLRAHRVSVQRTTGGAVSRGAAQRARDGRWRVWFGNEPMRTLPGDAVPAELVPHLIARTRGRRFSGMVLLAGYGFATAKLRVRPIDGKRVRVALETALGRLASEVELDAGGAVVRVRAADAVGAHRVDLDELARPFEPPELVTSSSLQVANPAALAEPEIDRAVLRVTGATRPPPPELPGQRVRVDAAGWTVTLSRRGSVPPHLPRREGPPADSGFAALARRIVERAGATDRTSELAALVRATEELLVDDTVTAAADPRSALSLGRGDCTSHAVLLAALAAARGIDTRLVTGYRLDGDRLTRHRWVIAASGRAWIAVDPTYGEAPAAARLLGLAVHGASASDIAMVDELAFAGMRTARVELR